MQRTQPLNKKSRKKTRNWKKSTDLQPILKLLKANAAPEEWMVSFSGGFVLHVTKQTNLYAVHHEKGNFNILEDEFRTLIAVLLLSVCCKVSYRNFYWANVPYTHNEAVSSAVCRNRFRELLLSFHLADNTQTTEGRYYKV